MKENFTLKGLALIDSNSKGGLDVSSWRTETPIIDKEVCARCGLCVSFCPEGAISALNRDFPSIDLCFCKGCGICSYECPSKAIKMVKVGV